MCSPNLESLFIEITNSNQPITVGVTYRPPNGDESLFHKEIDVLMKNLPSENVIVTGDFNINLLSSSCKSLEEIMFSNSKTKISKTKIIIYSMAIQKILLY